MPKIKAKAQWLGIGVRLNGKDFHFTFKEARAMHEVLSEAMLRLGVKNLDKQNENEKLKIFWEEPYSGEMYPVKKSDVPGMRIGANAMLAGLMRMGFVKEKYCERILEDFEGALEKYENE